MYKIKTDGFAIAFFEETEKCTYFDLVFVAVDYFQEESVITYLNGRRNKKLECEAKQKSNAEKGKVSPLFLKS